MWEVEVREVDVGADAMVQTLQRWHGLDARHFTERHVGCLGLQMLHIGSRVILSLQLGTDEREF